MSSGIIRNSTWFKTLPFPRGEKRINSKLLIKLIKLKKHNTFLLFTNIKIHKIKTSVLLSQRNLRYQCPGPGGDP